MVDLVVGVSRILIGEPRLVTDAMVALPNSLLCVSSCLEPRRTLRSMTPFAGDLGSGLNTDDLKMSRTFRGDSGAGPKSRFWVSFGDTFPLATERRTFRSWITFVGDESISGLNTVDLVRCGFTLRGVDVPDDDDDEGVELLLVPVEFEVPFPFFSVLKRRAFVSAAAEPRRRDGSGLVLGEGPPRIGDEASEPLMLMDDGELLPSDFPPFLSHFSPLDENPDEEDVEPFRVPKMSESLRQTIRFPLPTPSSSR